MRNNSSSTSHTPSNPSRTLQKPSQSSSTKPNAQRPTYPQSSSSQNRPNLPASYKESTDPSHSRHVEQDLPPAYMPASHSEHDQREKRRRKQEHEKRHVTKQRSEHHHVDHARQSTTPKPKTSRPKVIAPRKREVYIPSVVTVAQLAKILNMRLAQLQYRMKRAGLEEDSSYDHLLSSDYATLLVEELGYKPVVDDEAAFDIHAPPVSTDAQLPLRPPIVTIMGHVDHGKTTLLDTLRSASVAKGEAGGITQHIGAFSVPISSAATAAGTPQSITFLDTPGHAAFSAMRARGANVTDIIVLVVAADDGIMPQTKEVIELWKNDQDQLSLVVAINKVDKPGIDLDRVKKALMAEGVQLEEFGGDIPAVHVSGLTGEGLPDLIETLSAVAEYRDLRAEADGIAVGHIIESNVHKGLGPVATVLVSRGCLQVGAHIISGLTQAKVRRMTDSTGKSIQKATPGMAVTVSGWKALPKAGEEAIEGSDSDIKKALANRERRLENQILHSDIEAINAHRRNEKDTSADQVVAPTGPKELRLIIKADVSGSGEALEGALNGIGNKIVMTKVIQTSVGPITESDVLLAKAANATIVGFSVSATRSIQNLASQNAVPITTSDIIYKLIDDIRARVIDQLPRIIEIKVTGEATVLKTFEIQLKAQNTKMIAGCRVTNGMIEKSKFARIIRKGETVYEGTLDTMRQLKKDITEARKGLECGLGFKDFADLHEGDLIQMFEKVEKLGVI
ncbi:hypothetical protein CVT24_010568 [Panaeolus cyanescens]|uniref:Translation initiation factor IF-2, mitochondrial n=1 Tax=Panaeolus cyanescens TaxID=181874 RepID=A0A409YYL1_9AGAR|nr:hypothetical protein CVT24_010568 [Panaeolus cyanescens]